jgi:hypothetical protein
LIITTITVPPSNDEDGGHVDENQRRAAGENRGHDDTNRPDHA